MTKRTIEIDDVLPDCVDSAIEEVREFLIEYLDENECDEVPCLHNDLNYDGRVNEIVDGAVPVWTTDIEAAWFLHGRDLEQAYANVGIGSNPRERDGAMAIYCYIEEQVSEWYQHHAKEVFAEHKSSKTKKEGE